MRYQGLVYRAHNPLWSFSPLSAEGAARHGGRFNPRGVPALYTSLSESVVLAEYRQGFPHRPQPTTLCAYEVDCEDIIDLGDTAQCEALGIDPDDLGCAWELEAASELQPSTWKLAERMIADGVAGVLVPSFAPNPPPGGRNLVFWQWLDTRPHQVILIDEDRVLMRPLR